MRELDEVIQFIIDTLSTNASQGNGSVVTIRIAPYLKAPANNTRTKRAITTDDILDAHEALESFDGNFKQLFGTRS